MAGLKQRVNRSEISPLRESEMLLFIEGSSSFAVLFLSIIYIQKKVVYLDVKKD
jgi:hypothetical protein